MQLGLFRDDQFADSPELRLPRKKRQIFKPLFERPAGWRPHEELPELHGVVALDLETKDVGLAEGKGSSWHRADGGFITGVGIGSEPTGDFYLPIRHIEGNLDPERVLRWLRAQAKKPDVTFVYCNAPYDLGWLSREDINPCNFPHDVQGQAALIDEFKFDYSLDALGREYLGQGKADREFKEACLRGGVVDPMSHMDLVPGWLAEAYGVQDIAITRRLLPVFLRQIEQQQLHQVYELERQCMVLAVEMKARGVAVDGATIERVRRSFVAKRQEYLLLVHEKTGVHISPSDPQSIIRALRVEQPDLQLPRTSQGRESIKEEVLDALPDSDVVTAIRWARKYDRAIGTFIDSYLIGSQYKGRIHADFHPLRRADDRSSGGTTSGRFASSNPNLQNIPIRIPEIGIPLRSCFVADPGCIWVKLDYASQEPRLTIHYAHLMHLKGAAAMVQRFIDDPMTDLHLETALLMFGHTRETWEMLDKAMKKRLRGRAKVINLAIAYGAGGANIARQLGLPTMMRSFEKNGEIVRYLGAGPEAQALLDKHLKAVPFLKSLQGKAKERAEEVGYIVTILGRRVRFKAWGGQYARTHKALNAVIQGSAADQMKRAAVDLRNAGILIPLLVHDEGDVMVEERGADAFIAKVKHLMEVAVPLSLPVIAEVKRGRNWGEVSVD